MSSSGVAAVKLDARSGLAHGRSAVVSVRMRGARNRTENAKPFRESHGCGKVTAVAMGLARFGIAEVIPMCHSPDVATEGGQRGHRSWPEKDELKTKAETAVGDGVRYARE